MTIQAHEISRMKESGFIQGVEIFEDPRTKKSRWCVTFWTHEGHREDLETQRGQIRTFATADAAIRFLARYGFETAKLHLLIEKICK